MSIWVLKRILEKSHFYPTTRITIPPSLLLAAVQSQNGGIALYSIKEANFNENFFKKFHICLWSGLRGPDRKMSFFLRLPFSEIQVLLAT